MTGFWILCALLLGVALLFVVWPLWRGAAKNNAVARDAANLEIFRDQAAELEADLANGLLSPELYEQGKRELQARLLDEVNTTAQTGRARNPLKALALVLAVLIPAGAAGLYWKLGNQDALLPQEQHATTEGFGAVLSAEALKKLEEKLAKKPEDPEGWLLLARSYVELERFTDAVRAYDNLTRLVPNEAQLWADYADAYAMTQGQTLQGKPTELINRALALDPNHTKALALAGSAAMERGDYATAVKDWDRLYQELPEQDRKSEMGVALAGGLEQARNFLARQKAGKLPQGGMGAPAEQAAGKERITGTVTLADSVKAMADPGDTVYVLARAVDGSPMPLAVVRAQVRDLPLKFSLDDSMSMSQQAKLSDAAQVVIIARVSKSGNAIAQSGDLMGESAAVKPGAKDLKITIGSIVK